MQQNQTENTKYIDYLTEDTPIPGQLWVCISFLSPEGIKNCSVRGLKIRGVYGTRQEADERAKELQKTDPDFNVFVGEMGKWLGWDPDPNDVQDSVYQEKELNDLMKGYKDNLEKSKQMQHERKEDMIKKAAKEEQAKAKTNNNARLDKAKDRLKKKIEARNAGKEDEKEDEEEVGKDGEIEGEEIKPLTEKEKELKRLGEEVRVQDDYLKEERTKIDETTKQITNKEQKIETIDSKLAKIQELYDKLNKNKK
jgi:hypothetical protein